jgi:hypothetical protein
VNGDDPKRGRLDVYLESSSTPQRLTLNGADAPAIEPGRVGVDQLGAPGTEPASIGARAATSAEPSSTLRPRWKVRSAVRKHPILFGLVGAASMFGVLAVIIGAPVDTQAAVSVLLVTIGLGIHGSLGGLVGGRVRRNGSPRVVPKTRPASAVPFVLVTLLFGLFWYLVFRYSTNWPWLIGVAALAFGAGFLLTRPSVRSRLPKSSVNLTITDEFTPLAALTGVLVGLVVAAGLLFWSAAVDTWAPQHGPAIVSLPSTGSFAPYKDYVALGDSYSAGEGLDPVGQCHRSAKAYGRLLAATEGWNVDFEACSGAVISDVLQSTHYGPQVDLSQPDPKVGLVTITIGGNDSLFSNVVIACISHPTCMWGNFPPTGVQEVQQVLNGRPAPLEHEWAPATMLSIADKLGAPHDGLFSKLHYFYPTARIVVIGYPYLFPDGQAPTAPDLLCASILRRVDQPDRAEIRYMQDLFNDAIFEAATRQGVDYISPRLLWTGHEPCGTHGQWSNSIEAYLNIYKPMGGGSFHPNAAGQQALAALVSCYLRNNTTAPTAQSFETPSGWLTPPDALRLSDGQPFPHEWGSSSSDFAGCAFPSMDSGRSPR